MCQTMLLDYQILYSYSSSLDEQMLNYFKQTKIFSIFSNFNNLKIIIQAIYLRF